MWIVILSAVPGLFGAAGVALAAAGAHLSGTPIVTTAADFLLFHAAALVALCATATVSPRPTGVCIAASLLALGPALFSGDLALRGLVGVTPLHFAAPTGGIITIAGWLFAAIAVPLALRGRRLP